MGVWGGEWGEEGVGTKPNGIKYGVWGGMGNGCEGRGGGQEEWVWE